MADLPLNIDLAISEEKKAERIVEALKAKQITTLEELKQLLKDPNPQARFHRQLKLLWNLILWDTSGLDKTLLNNAISVVTDQLLGENFGPHYRNYVATWNVAPEFRPFYWLSLWYDKGDRVFLHLWRHSQNKNQLDLDSLYWILNFAMFKNYLAIFQTLWDHPHARSLWPGISVDRILKILREEPKLGRDTVSCKLFVLTHIDNDKLANVKEKDEAVIAKILDKVDATRLAKEINAMKRNDGPLQGWDWGGILQKKLVEMKSPETEIDREEIEQAKHNLS